MNAPTQTWEAFRGQMTVTNAWAYWDYAAVAPLSSGARQVLQDWAAHVADHGDTRWASWRRGVEDCRRRAAQLVGASPEEIAFVANTTTGINLVAEGFPWKPGDNVVTLADEFPSNLYPWMQLADRGVETRQVPAAGGQFDLADLARACNGRTRLVAVSWVEYATGRRLDLAAVAEIAAKVGARLFVDAIQGLGVIPLDVRNPPIDFLAADGHKWLLGPEGAGIFYTQKAHLEWLRPVGVGWNSVQHAGDFSDTRYDLKATAGRYEGGTYNMPGIHALSASLQLLLELGIGPIWNRVQELTALARERLLETGAQIVSDCHPNAASAILAFSLPNTDPEVVRRHCLSQGVALACRRGHLRISGHACNNAGDLARLVEALQSARGH